MKQVLGMLQVGRLSVPFSEALVLAILWFFVLKAFTQLALTYLSFAVATLYVLWIIVVNAVMYALIRITLSTRNMLEAIITSMGLEDRIPRHQPRRNIRFILGAVLLMVGVIVTGQGLAAVGAHLILPYLGKVALSEGLWNTAILMSIGGGSIVFLPFVLMWGMVKFVHGRVVQNGGSSSRPVDEGLRTLASKLSNVGLPRFRTNRLTFPIQLTGVFNFSHHQNTEMASG